jgi:hypothetical protein
LHVVGYADTNRVYKYDSIIKGLTVNTEIIGDTLFDSDVLGLQLLIETLDDGSGSLYNSSSPKFHGINNRLTFGRDEWPTPSSPGQIYGMRTYISPSPPVATADTLNDMTVFLHWVGSTTPDLDRYYETLYGYYSDLTDIENNVLTGYHFYGEGDFPSYFGGDIHIFDADNDFTFSSKIPRIFSQSDSGLTNWNAVKGDYPDADYIFASNNEGYWGGVSIMNISNGNAVEYNDSDIMTALNTKTHLHGALGMNLIGINNTTEAAVDSGWIDSTPWIRGIQNTISMGDNQTMPSGNFERFMINESRMFDWDVGTDTITVSNGIQGYLFRFAGQVTASYDADVHGFYSDLTSINSSKLLGNSYHFYGEGDFPSYFGGDITMNGLLTNTQIVSGADEVQGIHNEVQVTESHSGDFDNLVGVYKKVSIDDSDSTSHNENNKEIHGDKTIISYKLSEQLNPFWDITGTTNYIDWVDGSDTVDVSTQIAHFRARSGTIGASVYFDAPYYMFHSDPEAVGSISAKMLGSNQAYHFYGEGDYPSYFGGDLITDGSYNFGADAQADDDYEISIPEITTLTTGMTVTFTATTLNTGAATLEITEIGDIDALVKAGTTAADALVTGDIVAGQVVVAVFDGTNWQVTSRLAQ